MDTTRWKKKTDAAILSPARAAAWKREGQRHVIGVMGFSGAWRRSGHAGVALERYVSGVHSALRTVLQAAAAEHSERLVMCSGATNIGVPGAAYAECAALGVSAMGVTAGAAIRYRLAPMDVLVPVGRRFGDESGVFVRLCDAFVVLGGGPQSAAEARAAQQQGKPLTFVQGFGGFADEATRSAFPAARWITRRWDQPSPSTPPSGR